MLLEVGVEHGRIVIDHTCRAHQARQRSHAAVIEHHVAMPVRIGDAAFIIDVENPRRRPLIGEITAGQARVHLDLPAQAAVAAVKRQDRPILGLHQSRAAIEQAIAPGQGLGSRPGRARKGRGVGDPGPSWACAPHKRPRPGRAHRPPRSAAPSNAAVPATVTGLLRVPSGSRLRRITS